MNLRANPYVGQYTNEELQEWVKELQGENARLNELYTLLTRYAKNCDRIIELNDKIAEEMQAVLTLYDQATPKLIERIDRLESAPIQPVTLAALSPN